MWLPWNWEVIVDGESQTTDSRLGKAGDQSCLFILWTCESIYQHKRLMFVYELFQEGLPCLETVSVNCTSLTKTIDIFSKVRPYAIDLHPSSWFHIGIVVYWVVLDSDTW